MRAYSIDLRERVVKAVAKGLSRREAARRLDVGAATAVRWAQQWATTGTLAAAVGKPGRSPLEAHADFLLDLWTKQPDITLEELQTELAVGLDVTTGLSSIHRFFARRNITFKKKRCTPPSKPGLTLRRRERLGKACNPRSIPRHSSSSTRPGLRRT